MLLLHNHQLTDWFLSVKDETLDIDNQLLQSFIHFLVVQVIALLNGCQLLLFDATIAEELYMSIYIHNFISFI